MSVSANSRAELPASTVARIEAGDVTDPKFRTVERLVRAAGGLVSITPASGQSPGSAEEEQAAGSAPIPHEHLRDEVGRHFPAHLDVRETFPLVDKSNRLLDPGTPIYEYDRHREYRDARRERAARSAYVRVTGVETVTARSWVWTARTNEAIVGQLYAWVWSQEMTLLGRRADFLLCRLSLMEGWRAIGIEQRLLRSLREVVAHHGFLAAVTLGHGPSDVAYLRSFGFHPPVRWLATLELNT